MKTIPAHPLHTTISGANRPRACQETSHNPAYGDKSKCNFIEEEPTLPSQWLSSKYQQLVEPYGDPVHEEFDDEEHATVKDINEDFFAAALGEAGNPQEPTVFVPTEDKFFKYDASKGIYVHQREAVLAACLSRTLLDCARACRDACDTKILEFRFRDSGQLSGIVKKARGILQVSPDYFSNRLDDFVPCANGMLRMKDKVLLPFAPSYRRRNKLVVLYIPGAKCPLFLETLMQAALDADDLDLLQRWAGLALIGENLAQKILILSGTAGGGKGTFINVLVGIIGQMNIGSLRPRHLNDRFELGRLMGKTLLYGADVPEDFLNQQGASVLKSLTGHDLVTLEFKNSNEQPSMICKLNIVMTCNSRLTVQLEGDAEAWRRRLAIIEYSKPKPRHVIADLAQRILAEEASGVLNWMLEGLDKLRAAEWQLRLSDRQQARVDNLLLESDGHALFVRERLIKMDGGQVIAADCFTAYQEFCIERGWTALQKNKFGSVISDAILRHFGVSQRNDIAGVAGRQQRGWRGIVVNSSPKSPAKIVSGVSATTVPDRTDTETQVGFEAAATCHPQLRFLPDIEVQPTQYIPKCPDDFIGPAAGVVKILNAKMEALRKGRSDAVKVLLHGPPGTGKTQLTQMIARQLAENPSCIESINGCNLRIDVVRSWQEAANYKPMFGQFSVKIVNELDSVPDEARDLLLTYLDEMPRHVVFIGTSNHPEYFTERFSSRLQFFEVGHATEAEISSFLSRWDLPDAVCRDIAVRSGGNVRKARGDAQTHIDVCLANMGASH